MFDVLTAHPQWVTSTILAVFLYLKNMGICQQVVIYDHGVRFQLGIGCSNALILKNK